MLRPTSRGLLGPTDSTESPCYLGHRASSLVSSRGCYARCAFCCVAAWHEQGSPGKRFRLRPVADVADEMVWLNRNRGVDVFIFQDDNFLLPRARESCARIEALATALEQQGIGRFATAVKARPPDVTAEVLHLMQSRLGLVRLFLGVENASEQGLRTLGRGVRALQNRLAMDLLCARDVNVCFNLLIFDPDTTLESLETNLAFMQRYAEMPFNFGRVELYAGTPLLARMQAAGRCTGNYLAWDYRLGSPEIQRIFELFRAYLRRPQLRGGLTCQSAGGEAVRSRACPPLPPRGLPNRLARRGEAAQPHAGLGLDRGAARYHAVRRNWPQGRLEAGRGPVRTTPSD